VMIYFDLATRKMILERMVGRVSPSSYLMMGTAESSAGLSYEFEPVAAGKTVFYRRK